MATCITTNAVSECKTTDNALVSPPQKVVEMINRLQDLEESEPVDTDEVLTNVAEKDGKGIVIEEEIPEKDVIQEPVQQAEEVEQDVVDNDEKRDFDDFEPSLQTILQPEKDRADDTKEKLLTAVRTNLIEMGDKSLDSEVTPSELSADETFASGDKFETDEAGMDTSSPRPSEASRKEISVETTTASKPSAETQA